MGLINSGLFYALLATTSVTAHPYLQNVARQEESNTAIFAPPHSLAPADFVCDYSAMGNQWKSCSEADGRDCWLTNGNDKFDINTDYDKTWPTGVTRRYTLDISEMTLTGDGFQMKDGQVFNQQYPGPWIRACWGDDLEVTVTNRLKHNGTSIHWHGLRQLNSNAADGVNGITQCPIAGAPNPDTFVYKFKATQYGTSWYHSHYSLQYANGLLGPITIYGPSSANWDASVEPLLMTDSLHQSAFSLYYREYTYVNGKPIGAPQMANILLNGLGQYQCTAAETTAGTCVQQNTRYNTTFTPGKKYLLRLINTSVATTFAFSIDNHDITVMSSDFVPIKPYTTKSVMVGIGQRYHVVVEAKPLDGNTNQNYWIRTVPTDGCGSFSGTKPQSNTGILYYEGNPQTLPTSQQNTFSTACADEPYDKLVPIVPWQVAAPASPQDISHFQLGLDKPPNNNTVKPVPSVNASHWHMGEQTMWLDFDDPTIQSYNKGREDFPPWWVVVPKAAPADAWVYLMVQSAPDSNYDLVFPNIHHPMHLHGHDFVLLSQQSTPYQPGVTKLNLNNPPRRDVVLLPKGGHIVIAFKADNPGSWLFHCHIAWHASNGLAVQILERDGSIQYPSDQKGEVDRVCSNWNSWHGDNKNWYHDSEFQEDSGI